ncbi:type IIL restriction-modification enzyme MmeI [Ectopseudomonas oleovorans]|uniref:type IIL restriction-modification enzyme MmeI n=1 Tax=Ectopseudomonas oleovorans TaxID=301 RepID=UPI0034CF8F10
MPYLFARLISSRLHVVWALAAGGRLGVGNDPRYNKTRCFETFPFPDAPPRATSTDPRPSRATRHTPQTPAGKAP